MHEKQDPTTLANVVHVYVGVCCQGCYSPRLPSGWDLSMQPRTLRIVGAFTNATQSMLNCSPNRGATEPGGTRDVVVMVGGGGGDDDDDDDG
jgi:hypothetical protein